MSLISHGISLSSITTKAKLTYKICIAFVIDVGHINSLTKLINQILLFVKKSGPTFIWAQNKLLVDVIREQVIFE
jgi:hypothetical protein